MQRGHWTVAALCGVGVATIVAALPLAWAALAIGTGAIVAVVVHATGAATRQRYAVLGTAYCLGLAAVAGLEIPGVGLGPSAWHSLAALGTVSVPVVAGGLLVRRAIGSVADAIAPGPGGRSIPGVAEVPGAVGRLSRVLGTLRTLVAVGGTIARFAGVVLGGVVAVLAIGVVTFVLDGLGVAVRVPWIGGAEVDVVLLGFVAAVLVGFYVLAGLRVLRVAATTGIDVGRDAGSQLAAARTDRTEMPAAGTRLPTVDGRETAERGDGSRETTEHEGGERDDAGREGGGR